LTGSDYTSAYIYNRLTASSTTDGTNTAYLASSSYDGSALTNITNMQEHDSAYTTSVIYRGNPTTITTPTSTMTQAFDIGGNVTSTTNNGVTSSVSTTSATNYAAPSSITTNSLSTSLTWSGFLGVTGVTDPNNDQASMAYDAFARPTTTTSPYGATTTYTYNDTASPPNHVATTNGHWVTSYLDGFGRTVQKNTGYGTSPNQTLVSAVNTTYAPCGCSPLGKVSAVSQPWISGTVYYTTYTYDALGRPTAIAAPDSTTNPSTTKYAYKGNQVTVTDPAGNTKIYTMDSFGNLLTVQETDPQLGSVTTSYTYDVMNHLIGVSMPRGTATQTRTFNYNVSGTVVTAFLQSATNPEIGTVSYTYNSNNTLASKTDAKGQNFTYGYDTYISADDN
jgi:YD repeat-containing protein